MKTLNEVSGHDHPKIYHPDNFAGFITKYVNRNNVKIMKRLHYINPFTSNDIFDRLALFLKYEYANERYVVEELIKETPNAYICLKIMDLSCMGAGKVKRGILEQFSKLLLLKKEYPQLVLFPMIDPRNPDLHNIFLVMKQHINDIGGFGFYPNIGYTLLDERLDEFFELANENKKACIIHTTDTTPVYYQGKDLETLLKPLRKYFFFNNSKKRKELCGNFCHPYFATERARQYKDMNFVFAHFGGNNSIFRNYILNAIQKIDNCWADDSYTFEEDMSDLIRYRNNANICRKIIPGRDRYMNALLKKNEQLTELNKEFAANALTCFRLK